MTASFSLAAEMRRTLNATPAPANYAAMRERMRLNAPSDVRRPFVLSEHMRAILANAPKPANYERFRAEIAANRPAVL